MLSRILAAVLVGLVTFSVQAEVFRWVSGDGSVHYSDVPPRDRPYSSVRVRPPVSVPMVENLKQSEGVNESRKAIEGLLAGGAENYARQKQAQEQAERCEKYRQQLDNIQSRLRAGYSNDRGNSLRQKRRAVSQTYSRECVLR